MEDNIHDWKWWLKYNIILQSGNAIQSACAPISWRSKGYSDAPVFIPDVYMTFWWLCFLERSVCQAVKATAWPTMFASLVFQDKESVVELVKLSIRYWLRISLSIVNSGTILALIHVLGSWGILAMTTLYAVFV